MCVALLLVLQYTAEALQPIQITKAKENNLLTIEVTMVAVRPRKQAKLSLFGAQGARR